MTAHRVLKDMLIAPFAVPDPGDAGTIVVDRDRLACPVVTAAAETRVLPVPERDGLMASVILKTDGGTLTLTVTGGWNAAADTTMTFDDAGDFVSFVSVDVGGTFYWRVIASEGVVESTTEEMDINALTALGAVPAVSDLLAASDQSASGDPTLSITVTELLSAAGDTTDLAAVPDVADRILLTDESVAGDPAKSTTVENFFSAIGDVTALGAAPAVNDILGVTDESAAGDPIVAVTVQELLDAGASAVNTTGVGVKNGATVTAVEGGFLFLHKTVLTLASTPIDNLGDEAGQGQFGGVKVYDFPAGMIFIIGSLVDGTITLNSPAINNWDGDVGLGSTVVLDHQDVASLNGAVMNNNDVSAGAADKIGVVSALSSCTALTETITRVLDGTTSDADLYLNFLLDDNGAHDDTIDADCDLTITFWWINLGDLA